MARLPTSKRTGRQFTKRQLAAHLRSLSREPFQDVLAMYLDSPPTEEAIQDVANRAPDKWMQAVMMISKLAGYTEQIDLQHTHRHFVALLELSDAELMERLVKALDNLGVDKKTLDLKSLTSDSKVIEHEPGPPSPSSSNPFDTGPTQD